VTLKIISKIRLNLNICVEILSFILHSTVSAQTKDELDLCMAIQANSFTSNTEAENVLAD
jgi:hypothetical protein